MTQTPDIWMLHTSQAGEGESQWGGCYSVEAHAHNDAAAMREATGMDWTVVPMVRADRPAQCQHQIAEPATISEGEAFQALSELTNALRERHYGRMPSEVQAAYDKAWTIVFAGEKRAPVTQQAPAHPDDAAADALAALMKAKLAEKRAKGYGGWDDKTQCPQQRLSDMLRAHVDKGDPVDVANFCAMLSARGEGIAAAPLAVQAAVPLPMVELFGVKDGQETCLGSVPMPPTMRARELLQDIGFRGLDDDDGDGAYAMAACEQLIEYCKAYYEAPAHPAQGVPDEILDALGMTGGEVDDVVARIQDISAERHDAEEARAALAATQPAAQGMDAEIQQAVEAERERICAAIKAEDDHCVDQGDYMLDSNDCIKIVRGKWVRPDYSLDAAQAKQGGAA